MRPMVEIVTPFRIGGGVFDLLVSGMYDTPLTVYREYIQNTCDAIQSSGKFSGGRVDIRIYPTSRRVLIRDNGPGLTRQEVERDLITIADSRKSQSECRGFRGIGRLSGLAFAEQVVFRTRASQNQKVVQLVWDGDVLRSCVINKKLCPVEIIKSSVDISEITSSDYPRHFFEVEIKNIARYAAGELLNRDLVRSYISEVCPVPFSEKFPFASEIANLFQKSKIPLFDLDIYVDNSEKHLERPYRSQFEDSETVHHVCTYWESIHASSLTGENLAAIGWIAHSRYLGAIPKHLSIRGIRARQGNLQIGDERIFDHLFSESRFNRWCIGEIHIVDPQILPNGRRDYFEPGPHIRHLENQIEPITRRISELCRNASSERNGLRKLRSELEQTEIAYELASSGYLKAKDARALVNIASAWLDNINRKSNNLDDWCTQEDERVRELRSKIVTFRPKRGRPSLGKVNTSEIGTYRKVFQALTKNSPSPEIALKTIEKVLECA